MIGKEIGKMLVENQKNFLIPAERVAHIQMTNHLDHALLVLTKIGYTVIPVLDSKFRIRGLISMSMVIDAITSIEDVDFKKLGDIRVEDVMQTDYALIDDPFDLEEVLHLLVRNSFVCVAASDGSFTGIVTRSEILKATNRIAHEFENKYDVKLKKEYV